MSYGGQEKTRRNQLLRALLRVHGSDLVELALSEPVRQALDRLLSSQAGGARRRLERSFVRHTPDSDWQLIDEFVDRVRRQKKTSTAAEQAILNQRENLIAGCAHTRARVSAFLSESDVKRLDRGIIEAQTYAGTPLGKGAQTRILKLIRKAMTKGGQ